MFFTLTSSPAPHLLHPISSALQGINAPPIGASSGGGAKLTAAAVARASAADAEDGVARGRCTSSFARGSSSGSDAAVVWGGACASDGALGAATDAGDASGLPRPPPVSVPSPAIEAGADIAAGRGKHAAG